MTFGYILLNSHFQGCCGGHLFALTLWLTCILFLLYFVTFHWNIQTKEPFPQ
jgi:hypothetical protein